MEKIGKLFRKSIANQIKDGVQKNKASFVVSFSGISAPQMNSIRKDFKKIGAQVSVTRNRIAALTLKELHQEQMAEGIARQTAFVWSNADSVEVSKALMKLLKAYENVKLHGGLVDGAQLGFDEVKRLSDLPSREVLLSTLLQVMLSPVTQLASDMNAKTRDLLSILKQL
ncbi:MAG: 50S ribosomal protein L10, partial [Candidatus Omnitrophota bacterium]|nr:50S ribosomal protein L10 [Candidatus Omnitrophota bacterium]